ncbi:MAG: hypothetical protein KO464_02265 [Candidatus Methanofastidiosum sp.]|nr:hypothetical protein [Methanofastidiosum sp.]
METSTENINWKKVGKWALIGGGVVGAFAAIVGAALAVVHKPESEEAQEEEGEGQEG